jgi:hypothetical protein
MIYEVKPDEARADLPPVRQLKTELSMFTRDTESTRGRLKDSFQYIEAIRMAKEKQRFASEEEAMRNQVLSELFLNSVEYFGNTSLFVMEGRGYSSWHTEMSQPYLHEASLARKRLLENIGTYSKLFADSSDNKKFEVLRTVMQDARCAVIGKDTLDDYQAQDTKHHMVGILAEHKVCSALRQNGWKQAEYSSPEQDLGAEIDIVIPFPDRDPLGVQVKGIQKYAEIGVKWKRDLGIVWVNTPMHESHSPLSLSEAHSGKLSRKIESFLSPEFTAELEATSGIAA